MATPETAEAAANLAALMLSDAASNGDENAARLLGQGDEAPQAPVVSSAPPAAEAAPASEAPVAEAAAEIVEPPNFDPVLSDDLAELLNEPDFEADAAAEVAAEFNEDDPDYDPAAEQRTRALEKRNQWLESQLVNANRGKWVAENLKAYPLLATYAPDEVKGITATSRRGFARECAALQDRYARALKPALDDLAAATAYAKAQAAVDAKTEVQAAWGKPIGDAGGVSPAEHEAALERARQQHAPLKDRIKILMGVNPRG